jgi:RNA polymerase sigma factor (TIGR02999 family)
MLEAPQSVPFAPEVSGAKLFLIRSHGRGARHRGGERWHRSRPARMLAVARSEHSCAADEPIMEPAITSLMAAADRGDSTAREALFSMLYAELHRMARRELARGGVPVTISATTLLHEAYLDMSARSGASFPDRARFMAYAARVMRGLIIDHARSRSAQKRGGQFEITSLKTGFGEEPIDDRELSRLSDALDELAQVEPSIAEIVDLKYFCGLSFAEIAAMRNVSERTVQRGWDKARIYLHDSLRASPAP